ncbi:MAG: sugar phosphate isomerase/epimerase [Thermomicrobiales bacterium]|nr:sugar phosphate isomerase/epimerase [Thermomicrobiales bacterium]
MDIAIQLYTVRDRTAVDMLGTLELLAALGYQSIESAGYGNSNPAAMRAVLDQTGMTAVSAHVSLDRLVDERAQVIEEMHTLGVQQIIVPWLAPERRTAAYTTTLIAHLNELAPALGEEGFTFGYHNHEFEFTPLEDGKTIMERVIAETDPSQVLLQIDLGWAQFAGADPVALIEENAGRVPTLHCKDLAPDNGPITTGDGILAWGEIIAAGRQAGTRCLIVENDQPGDDSLDDAARSLTNLQRLLTA